MRVMSQVWIRLGWVKSSSEGLGRAVLCRVGLSLFRGVIWPFLLAVALHEASFLGLYHARPENGRQHTSG